MKSIVWIAYDLGVRGDYESLFQFLDSHNAKECGDNLAVMRYEWKKDLIAELQKEIVQAVKFDGRGRVYLIYPGAKGSYKGRFLKGGRKIPPWTGFAMADSQEEDADE